MSVPSRTSATRAGSKPKRAEQERSRLAKRRILDAAVKVLVDEGYSNATTLRIQKEAGVSRGGLLHHFPSRDALLIASVHHLAAERFRDLGSRTDWPEEPRERISDAIDTMWATYAQPYFWASIELWVAARSHEELRVALLPAEQIMGATVRASTDVFFGAQLCGHPEYPRIRELLNTSMRGVAMTYALEPRNHRDDPHLHDWKTTAWTTLLSVEERAHKR
ncbi:TetR/AcrR family transcriptional regulator [Gordonia sp. NPDC003376]